MEETHLPTISIEIGEHMQRPCSSAVRIRFPVNAAQSFGVTLTDTEIRTSWL